MTQYKWLPEQPTEEMTMAWCANCHAWDLGAYKAMWKAAQEVEQEPVAGVVLREGLPTLLLNSNIKPADKRLYTHPQPKREKLSIEQLLKMHADNKFDWCATARAVEKYYTK